LNLFLPGATQHPGLGADAILSTDWQSPAAYGHTKYITAAGFAWEYLGCNDEYRRNYETIAMAGGAAARDLEVFAHRWNFRFPVPSRFAA